LNFLPLSRSLSSISRRWLTDNCIPLVREITFENAEELTEEGIPFLILFRHPDDKESEKVFTEAVMRELPDQKAAINCLVADGKKFAHPLHHLGKRETIQKTTSFVLDLHSGKLHREFHHGPDPVVQQVTVQPDEIETQPPPSVFEKLKPSHTRYTILDKDEL
ncbi:hypothetical protein COOONC_22356, partial [Cooperia oncophora]